MESVSAKKEIKAIPIWYNNKLLIIQKVSNSFYSGIKVVPCFVSVLQMKKKKFSSFDTLLLLFSILFLFCKGR